MSKDGICELQLERAYSVTHLDFWHLSPDFLRPPSSSSLASRLISRAPTASSLPEKPFSLIDSQRKESSSATKGCQVEKCARIFDTFGFYLILIVPRCVTQSCLWADLWKSLSSISQPALTFLVSEHIHRLGVLFNNAAAFIGPQCACRWMFSYCRSNTLPSFLVYSKSRKISIYHLLLLNICRVTGAVWVDIKRSTHSHIYTFLQQFTCMY